MPPGLGRETAKIVEKPCAWERVTHGRAAADRNFGTGPGGIGVAGGESFRGALFPVRFRLRRLPLNE